ncbi:MAG: conserved membrane protein of unknown function [Promethearchaeota archaeon]|nr:MAG: conserved membrane protein of unknown function [Candidatus Lokiarchaeota archaeon]
MDGLSLLNFVIGLSSLIFVGVQITIGIIISSKYFKLKEKTFLLIGIGWAGICSPWWASSVAFINYLIVGYGIPQRVYFLLGNAFLHIFITLYLYGILKLIYSKRRNLILYPFIIIGIAFLTYFFVFLILDPSVIGNLSGLFDVTYKSLVMIYLIVCMLTIFIPGIFLGRESLKSDLKELKFRGKLLIIAYILYLVGAFLDASIEQIAITLIATRTTLITGSVLFYLGFLMPSFVKNLFIKNI